MAAPRAPHVMLVVAPYYRDIVEQLVAGATAELEAAGATWERVEVAGAFEIPVAVSVALVCGTRIDGYVALGCVIRGETSHYDHICSEVARSLQKLAVENRLALGFGVLTCEDGEQARVRADPSRKNKGGEAARACLATIELKRALLS